MSYCEDCDEYIEPQKAAAPSAKISVEGDPEVTRAIIEAVAARYRQHADTRITKAIDEKIASSVEESVAQICREVIKPEIVRTVEEGWQRTNSYGENVGGKIGIKDRIGDMLNAKDGYNRDRTWIQKIAEETISKHLKDDFQKEINEAATALRKKLEGLVNDKFVTALKSSLGLR